MEKDSQQGDARYILQKYKVAVMILAYNAERYIHSVLARIPVDIIPLLSEIFVIDDFSTDHTLETAVDAGHQLGLRNFRAFRTPTNRGYGGSQKIGYIYAIEQGFDLVIMLHGDGQYAPEYLPLMIAPFVDPGVDVVLGSRMLHPRDALRGGMPLYKWVGNRALTWLENQVLGVSLSEFHTGYRAFRVSALKQIPYRFNSDVFHFDTEILIQFISAKAVIREVPIPTHYGDEVCHVNSIQYGWDCIKSVIRYRLFTMGLFYDPFLDFNLFETERFFLKKAPNSLHQFVLRQDFTADENVADLGAASSALGAEIAKRTNSVVAIDSAPLGNLGPGDATAVDLDGNFDCVLGRNSFDTVLAIDVIEHLEKPEAAVQKIGRLLRPGGRVLASTGNISFFSVRIMLLFGFFNYSKRGILDSTHKRLFTVSSFVHLFQRFGFKVESIRGFGPPIRDLVSQQCPFSWIDSILSFLAMVFPKLCSYNFLLTVRRLPSLEEIYAATTKQNGTDTETKKRDESTA